jgi:hypothetical protein
VVFWRTDLVRGLPGPALRFVERFGAAGVVATGAFSLADVTVTSGSVASLSPKEGKSLSVYSLTIKRPDALIIRFMFPNLSANRSVYVSTALLPSAFIFAIAFKASLALKPPRMVLAIISPLFLIRILLFKLSIPLRTEHLLNIYVILFKKFLPAVYRIPL